MSRVLLRELLYTMKGFPGDILTGEHLDFKKECIHPSENTIFYELCKLGAVYKELRENLFNRENYSAFNFVLSNSINDAIAPYENILRTLEKDDEYNDLTLTKFMKLTKYKASFFQTLNSILLMSKTMQTCRILNEIETISNTGDPLVSTVFNAIFSKIIHVFYDDLWHWLIFGFLRQSGRDFFILEENGSIKMCTNNLPYFVPLDTANKIFFVGNLVKWFMSNTSYKESEIFDSRENLLFIQLNELKNNAKNGKINREISQYVERVRKIASTSAWKYVIEKENFFDHLEILKTIHLIGVEDVWFNFLNRVNSCHKMKDIAWKKAAKLSFENALIDYYGEKKADEILNFVKIKHVDGFPYIWIEYNFPPLVQKIITEDTMVNYNTLFTFCLKLYSARQELSRNWLRTTKNKSINGLWSLRHRLIMIFEHLYYFYKVNIIERLFQNLKKDIFSLKDYEKIQSKHQCFVSSLMRESLLDIKPIHQNLTLLFNFCFDVSETTSENFLALEEKLYKICLNLYYLLINVKSYHLCPSLSQLIFQIDGYLINRLYTSDK